MKRILQIDALRGIAILSVVFYHLNIFSEIQFLSFFAGGFLGVDIFFVISGFLITNIFINQKITIENILKFYLRRFLRIFPLLIFVIICTTIYVYINYLPKAKYEFSLTVLYSLIGWANFYYVNLNGYFAEPTLSQPLINLWSLAIEIQFYVLFPLLLLSIKKNYKKKYIFLIILFLSLSSSITLFTIQRQFFIDFLLSDNFIFYNSFSRIWEFFFGVLVAQNKDFIYNRFLKYKTLLHVVGLFLILSSIGFFHENLMHPGFYTLFPVIGTCLLILFDTPIFTKLLINKINNFFGKISYSLYVWHYPILSFMYDRFGLLNLYEIVFGFFLSIIISMFTYNFIEQKLNKEFFLKIKLIPIILFFYILLLLIHYIGFYNKGSFITGISETREELISNRQVYWDRITKIKNYHNFYNSKKINVYVVGNSYVQDIAAALNFSDRFLVHLVESTGSNCKAISLPIKIKHQKECLKNKSYFEINFSNVDILIIGDEASVIDIENSQYMNELDENIKLAKKNKFMGLTFILGTRPTYKQDIPLFEWDMLNKNFAKYGSKNLEGALNYNSNKKPRQLFVQDQRISQFFANKEYFYISVSKYLCPEYNQSNSSVRCLFKDKGDLLYSDGSHLNISGTKFISKNLSEQILNTLRYKNKVDQIK